MKADLAKLRALHEAAFQWPLKNLDAFVEAMHEALPELLAIAEAVERAPVFAADLFSQDGRIVGVDLNKHGAERVRLLAIGEDG